MNGKWVSEANPLGAVERDSRVDSQVGNEMSQGVWDAGGRDEGSGNGMGEKESNVQLKQQAATKWSRITNKPEVTKKAGKEDKISRE